MIFLAFFTSSRTEPSTWLISICWALLSVLVTKTEGTRLGWRGSSLVTWLTFDEGTDHTLDKKSSNWLSLDFIPESNTTEKRKKKRNQEKLYWLWKLNSMNILVTFIFLNDFVLTLYLDSHTNTSSSLKFCRKDKK